MEELAARKAATARGDAALYSIGGSVSGLSGTVVLQDDSKSLSVSGNGSFVFGAPVADRSAYEVSVSSSPVGQICTVSNGSGTVSSADVTDVAVACGDDGGGAPESKLTTGHRRQRDFDASRYLRRQRARRPGAASLGSHQPCPGSTHNFLYVLPVEAGTATTYGDGLETLRALDAQNEYNLTIIEPSFGIESWYADNPNDPNHRYETFLTRDLLPWVTKNLGVTGHEQNWLIGFSKSGIGAADLLLKHPDLFTLAASWDFPADSSAYDQFGSSSADSYGTNANFQANYRLTPAFVDAHKAPFLSSNRIWIGGYQAFQTDLSDYDALLTSDGIPHTTETPTPMAAPLG